MFVPPFAMTGLTTRGGLSNWTFFFFPREVVLCDTGVGPALKAGFGAGLRHHGALGAVAAALVGENYGPQQGEYYAVEHFCAELERDAKRVLRVNDADVRHVRLHLRALAHQFFMNVAPGLVPEKFTAMNRGESIASIDLLRERFGSRFELSKTGVYAFFDRYAPILMR